MKAKAKVKKSYLENMFGEKLGFIPDIIDVEFDAIKTNQPFRWDLYKDGKLKIEYISMCYLELINIQTK